MPRLLLNKASHFILILIILLVWSPLGVDNVLLLFNVIIVFYNRPFTFTGCQQFYIFVLRFTCHALVRNLVRVEVVQYNTGYLGKSTSTGI